MDIAVIGAGNVGTTLGTAWVAKGHRVCYGVRDTASPKLAGIDRARTPVLTVAEAAKAEYERTMAVVNDIGMTIAARAGRTETNFKLSADLGCLIPIEE